MTDYEVPVDLVEDRDALIAWAKRAHAISRKMITMKSIFLTLIGLVVVAVPARGDVVYGNYSPANGHASTWERLLNAFPNPFTRVGVPFRVPLGYDYTLDSIEIVAFEPLGSLQFDRLKVELYEGPNSNGPLDPFWSSLGSYNFNPLPRAAPGLVDGVGLSNFAVGKTLKAGKQYWLLAIVGANPPALTDVRWMHNNAGVSETILRLDVSSGLNNWIPTPSSVLPVFRILGTPVTAQPVKPSYSSYTAPPGGGLATLFLEVVCANMSNPFTMPVSVQLPMDQTPAQVCQLLASAINTCDLTPVCPCWGACPGGPTNVPWGFQADCSGSVLRVGNSTVGVCPGAFVCADSATGLIKYSARKQLDGVSGAIAMEIRGVATGVALDPNDSNIVTITRTLRCAPDSPPQVFQAEVMLAPKMEADQIIQSLAAAFSSQGDANVVIEANRLVFLPPCPQGNYDIAFQVNDTGLDYAYSPRFDYSFFDYVAQFPDPFPIPTPSECGNGALDGVEECDDGNTEDGDGCSSICTVENPQSRGQQRCINTLNKNFAKVAGVRSRENFSCIRDASIGRLSGTIEDCLTGDRRGVVVRAQTRAARSAAKKCTSPPSFGPNDAAVANAAAVDKEVDLLHDIFGLSLDGGVIVERALNRDTAKCQQVVARTTNRCQNTLLREFNRCKRIGLRAGTIVSRPTLEECLGADPSDRVFRSCDASLGNIRRDIDRRCVSQGVRLSDAFPGCGTDDPAALAGCLETLVACRACMALNAVDNLAQDCDEFDDGIVNGSCP